MNCVIVTADDFGLATEVNHAVEIAHRRGILSAASLMIAGPAAKDAIDRARRMPGLRIGLHLVLTDGHPALASEQIPDLVDRTGEFRTDMVRTSMKIAFQPAVARQVYAEIGAQFEAFRATGLQLDHVNAHKHFHLHPMIAAKVISIGQKYGMRALRVPIEPSSGLGRTDSHWPGISGQLVLPWMRWLRRRARRAHVVAPDAVFGLKWSGAITGERLAGVIANLPPGIIEIYTHPAISDHFAGCAQGYAYTGELAALTSEAVIDALRRSQHRLVGYSDLDS